MALDDLTVIVAPIPNNCKTGKERKEEDQIPINGKTIKIVNIEVIISYYDQLKCVCIALL